jgi:serine/threonine-protein kinase
VYEADATHLGRVVALKIISEARSQDPLFRQRLRREWHSIAQVQDPHVVPIHKYDEIDGRPYVEMRLIDGSDLSTVLKRDGRLNSARAVAIVQQIASALDAAHKVGVTHGDIKPGNILITGDDFAYVVDFGINAATDEDLDDVGTAIGPTYVYTAPERFSGEKTNRADVYSLACVLFECLTGSPPFADKIADLSGLVAAHLLQSPPCPSQSHSDIPDALDEVIAKGLAKDPDERYATAGDLARAAQNALTAAELQQDEIPAVTLSDTTQAPQVGSQFGPYLLRRLLGRGGMGDVYEAEDTRNDHTVALKLLPEAFARDPTYRQRLQREARAVLQVHDPHVVPINDFGEIDGHLYVDMQLIDGTDLGTILHRHGPISPVRAVTILRQIASALDAAHDSGLMHRDVKPPNILITPDDFAYLVDFGVAVATADQGLTNAGQAIGTYAYMAPERFQRRDVDFRADIYALTCVLYECLTGSPPYQSESIEVIITRQLTQPPPRPTDERPYLPKELDDVIARGMAKKPEDRYESAGALASAAQQAVGGFDEDQPVDDIRLMEAPAFPTPAAEPAPTDPRAPLTYFAGYAGPHVKPLVFYDDVCFSAFRPTFVRFGCWSSLLACVHLGGPPPSGDKRGHPLPTLKRRARGILGDQLTTYVRLSADSPVGLPEETEITVVLDLPGFEVHRPSRTFLWINAFHMEEYHVRAGFELQGVTARGRLLSYHDGNLLSEITLAIRVLGPSENEFVYPSN